MILSVQNERAVARYVESASGKATMRCSQDYNDGIVTIYSVSNAAQQDTSPKKAGGKSKGALCGARVGIQR